MVFLYKLLTLTLLLYSNLLIADEKDCPEINGNIKSSLLTDNFYNYQDYIHYSLGNFTNKNKVSYEFNSYKEQISLNSDVDLIFGEYYELKKLNLIQNNLEKPNYISKFYQNNFLDDLENESRIYPLDIDIFIITSKENNQELKFEEDLYKFKDELKYTISQSFFSNIENIKFLNHLTLNNNINLEHPAFESILFKQNKKYSILNKNTFLSKYDELLLFFNNNESIFQVSSDGFAYKNNLEFLYYPNSKNIWDKNKGKFTKNLGDNIIKSFYGFSVIVNSDLGNSYICYITQPSQREIIISSFDIGVSPLSVNDITDKNNISSKYKELLDMKKKPIKEIDLENIIFNKILHNKYLNFIARKDYDILYNENLSFF